MMLRTRPWRSLGNNPATRSRVANSASAFVRNPRSWMLPRVVSSSTPLPSSVAAVASSLAAGAPMRPPGIRTRASPPSAAAQNVRTPGHASGPGRRSEGTDTPRSYGAIWWPDTVGDLPLPGAALTGRALPARHGAMRATDASSDSMGRGSHSLQSRGVLDRDSPADSARPARPGRAGADDALSARRGAGHHHRRGATGRGGPDGRVGQRLRRLL